MQPLVDNTESDMTIARYATYVSEEEKKMVVILRRIRNIIHPTRGFAAALLEAAETMHAFGTIDENKSLSCVGNLLAQVYFWETKNYVMVAEHFAFQKVSKLTSFQANSTYIGFLEPFKEYCRMLKSISLAIDLRKKAKDRYLTAYAEYDKQQNIYKRILLTSEKTKEGFIS